MTAVGAIMGSQYLWIISVICIVIVALNYEMLWVSLFAYLPEVATDAAGRGKLAAYRQSASLTSQLLFTVVLTGITLSLKLDDVFAAIVGNIIVFLWVLVFLPFSWNYLGD